VERWRIALGLIAVTLVIAFAFTVCSLKDDTGGPTPVEHSQAGAR
jgi:hypothetical protein